MTLSRWRRVATGVAAGVLVLCAALLGASFRSDSAGVSVAADVRPPNATRIEIDVTPPAGDEPDSDAVRVIEDPEPLPASDETDEADETNGAEETATADEVAGAAGDTPPADTDDTSDTATEDAGDADEPTETGDPADDAGEADEPTETAAAADPPAPAPTSVPAPPLTNNGAGLGTGGGVDDAECALDRVVIYAGARVGGVAGSIRSALAQAGFGAGCPTPVTVLASNCPLQFSGVLGAGSGYDPNRSFVAASASVDRETMTAVMGAVGYTGNSIDILDFGFVNPDRPGEQWLAIFVPPSFSGWENLAARAGVPATAQSLCAPSGELAG